MKIVLNDIWGFLLRIGSRKFIGLIIATLLLIYGKLSGQLWLYAFFAYIGVEGANDFIKIVKANQNAQ